MMKVLFAGLYFTAAISGVAHAEAKGSGETAYPRNAIGYEALMSGDNDQAVRDLLNGTVSRHDPAFLLNLGQAYARSGRVGEAREIFRQAARKREQVDLVLADGRVINSGVAARQALATVQVGLAAR